MKRRKYTKDEIRFRRFFRGVKWSNRAIAVMKKQGLAPLILNKIEVKHKIEVK